MGAEVIIFGQSLNSQFLKGLTHSAMIHNWPRERKERLVPGAIMYRKRRWRTTTSSTTERRSSSRSARTATRHQMNRFIDWTCFLVYCQFSLHQSTLIERADRPTISAFAQKSVNLCNCFAFWRVSMFNAVFGCSGPTHNKLGVE